MNGVAGFITYSSLISRSPPLHFFRNAEVKTDRRPVRLSPVPQEDFGHCI